MDLKDAKKPDILMSRGKPICNIAPLFKLPRIVTLMQTNCNHRNRLNRRRSKRCLPKGRLMIKRASSD